MNVEEVRSRRAALDRRITAVPRRWAHPVEIVAVTKGFDGAVIRIAGEAGFAAVGENYAQELLTKTAEIEAAGVEVHFIGRLQTNKVRLVAGIVDVWSSLDRPSVIDEVAKRVPGARVLVQVDTTDDPAKGGCRPDDVRALVDRARAGGLDVAGLMTVGPTGRPPDDARAGFRAVRGLVDELALEVCSMGMSGDLEVAVEEGSTQVRVGTDLFGPRPVHRRPAGLR